MKLEDVLFEYKDGKIIVLPTYDRISGELDYNIEFHKDENEVSLWSGEGIAHNICIEHYYDFEDGVTEYNEYDDEDYCFGDGEWGIMFSFISGWISYHDRYNKEISRDEFASKYPLILQKFEKIINSFHFTDGINHIADIYYENLLEKQENFIRT